MRFDANRREALVGFGVGFSGLAQSRRANAAVAATPPTLLARADEVIE